MKLVDVNLLVHATNPQDPRHEAAGEWLEQELSAGHRVGLPWHSVLGFIRVSTNPAAMRAPLAMADALDIARDWLDHPHVWMPEPTADHMVVLAGLLRAEPRSRMVPDAHLAALAIEHGLTLCSADNHFRLFPGLRFLNPLE